MLFDDIFGRDYSAFRTSNKPNVYQAGFPCQSFSQAGHKKGASDPRGTIVN